MAEFPRSLIEFQKRFSDEADCAAYLREARWPKGFVCPACGGVRGGGLRPKRGRTSARRVTSRRR